MLHETDAKKILTAAPLERSDAQSSASECPDVKNKWRLNPDWHSMLYSCTHMATVGVKGLTLPPIVIWHGVLWQTWRWFRAFLGRVVSWYPVALQADDRWHVWWLLPRRYVGHWCRRGVAAIQKGFTSDLSFCSLQMVNQADNRELSRHHGLCGSNKLLYKWWALPMG